MNKKILFRFHFLVLILDLPREMVSLLITSSAVCLKLVKD